MHVYERVPSLRALVPADAHVPLQGEAVHEEAAAKTAILDLENLGPRGTEDVRSEGDADQTSRQLGRQHSLEPEL